jgi:hypothetical protein
MKTLLKSLFMKPESNTLDIKSIMIVILFLIAGIFFTQWYFGGENHRKERISLEKQNKELGTKSDDLLAALETGDHDLDDLNAWAND